MQDSEVNLVELAAGPLLMRIKLSQLCVQFVRGRKAVAAGVVIGDAIRRDAADVIDANPPEPGHGMDRTRPDAHCPPVSQRCALSPVSNGFEEFLLYQKHRGSSRKTSSRRSASGAPRWNLTGRGFPLNVSFYAYV